MAFKKINTTTLDAIASAIRGKLGVNTTYKPTQMAGAIESIQTPKLEEKRITANGDYYPSAGKNGFSHIIADVFDFGQDEEGKVVQYGNLVEQTSITKVENGTYNTTFNNQVKIKVPARFVKALFTYEQDSLDQRTQMLAPSGSFDIYIVCDAILADTVETSMLTAEGATINSVTRVNRNVLKVNMTATEGDSLVVTLTPDCFEYSGDSATASATYETSLDAAIGASVFMQNKGPNSRTDSGTITISVNVFLPFGRLNRGKNVNGTVYLANPAVNISVSSDSYIECTTADTRIDVNQRDNSYYAVYFDEREYDEFGRVAKIRWEGMNPYGNTDVNEIFEVYFFKDGGVMVFVEKLGPNRGNFSIYGKVFSADNGKYISAYYKNGDYEIAYEPYRELGQEIFSGTPLSMSFEDLQNIKIYEMMILYSGTTFNDSGIITCQTGDIFSFPYGSGVNSFGAHGNSYVTVGSSRVSMAEVDSSSTIISAGVYDLTDLDVRVLRLDWKGKAVYNGATDREWQLYLFANGDAMIYIDTIGSRGGTNSFLGTTYTAEDNSFISFYKQSSGYDVQYELYDISKHVEV